MLQLQGSDPLLLVLILAILQVDSENAGTELNNPANSSISPCSPFCDGIENSTDMNREEDYVTLDYIDYEERCGKQDVRVFRSHFLPPMYFIIFFIGLAGNGLVMLRYLYFKRLKTGTDYYMLNLAIADIVFLLTLPFWAVSISYNWVFGSEMCKVTFCLSKMSFISGMFLLMSVSIERYFAIVQAPSAHRHRAKTVLISKLTSVSIWVLAFTFSIPELINSDIRNIKGTDVCTIYSANLQSLEVTLKITQMVLGFLLPFIIMSLCYSMIIRTLLRARNFEKYKAIKVIIAIVIAFVIFQLPYNSVMLVKTLYYNTSVCTQIKKLDIADDVTYSLACLRCCLNPFLYAIIGVKFRNDMCTFFKDLGCLSNEKFSQWSTAKPSKRSSFAMDTETTTTFSP
ncbi:C-C chemokine receptor type 7 isoform X1 [Bufo bufo]|uniref:C-C chemokine receptor type 7 isoform X1 n=1 Tax=Bufo bufo TaxID=8384 RepID=UPI001ABEA5AF|nr:C-C chemokine receptor type 7 isoform X1 [Bufo bufo]